MDLEKLIRETAIRFFIYIDELENAYNLLVEQENNSTFLTLARQLLEITRCAEIFAENPKNFVSYSISQNEDKLKFYKKCISDQIEINDSFSEEKINIYNELSEELTSIIEELNREFSEIKKWSNLIGDWGKERATGEAQMIFISREMFNVLSEAVHCKTNFLEDRYKDIDLEDFLKQPFKSQELWSKGPRYQEIFEFWFYDARQACKHLI